METKNIKPKKKRDKKLVSLKLFGNTLNDLRKFRQEILKNLGDHIFHLPTMQILVFNILKEIYPVNQKVLFEDNSIENACEKVVKHFQSNIEVSIETLTNEGSKKIEREREKESFTIKFCKKIVAIDKVPGLIYRQLGSQVNKDLLSISELIKWYENQPCIQRYLEKNKIPEIHEDRKVLDFYKRCVIERIEILNYQLYGLKERVLAKSRYTAIPFTFFEFYDRFYDRPYHFAQPFSIHYFDCREIDLVSHRLGEFTFEEGMAMIRLYGKNKIKFYLKYFKKNPIGQHFQNIVFHLPFLPMKNDRKPIFEELIRLFKARKWISFYALALPQVEGLFSEMCNVVSPEKNLSQSSLTYKVNVMRPFHDMSINYFDYYQYHIPLQRNKFAHTGFDEDFKLKSYDLLTDLGHLLTVFYELDNPLVKIKKLHTRRNFEDFITINEFSEYFKLLNQLKDSQKKEMASAIERFEKEFLSQDCNLEYTCNEMIQEIPDKVNEFVERINAYFKARHSEIQFKKMNKRQIEDLLADGEKFETMKDCFMNKNESAEILEDYFIFISNQAKCLPSLNSEIQKEINNLYSEFGIILKNIINTKILITNKKPD